MTRSVRDIPKGLVLIPALLFCISYAFKVPLSVKRSDYIAPPKIIKNLSLGLGIQLSDSFWLRAVQDFDYCSEPLNERECKGRSWLFQVLDLVTDLDKIFFHAYHWGGLALTVIISDYEGASVIFDKGVGEFPNDWMLNYAAGYHALFEEKNKLKASKLYFTAANNGAPDWVRVMAGRLAAEGGGIDYAEKILSSMIAMSDEPKYIARLQKKLSEIKSKRNAAH